MKVKVKNNRLILECKVDNLSTIPETKLRDIAAKYQIGWGRFVEKEFPVMVRGVAKTQKERVMEPKPRRMLEDEIRKYLSINLIIPKEYWTQEQEDAFMSNNLAEEKDITRENAIKEQAGISQTLPPYEKTTDKFAENKMFGILTEGQWEYFKTYYNSKVEFKKDEDGRIIGRETKYVHRLIADEMIPETQEEEESLKPKEKKEDVSED